VIGNARQLRHADVLTANGPKGVRKIVAIVEQSGERAPS